LVLDKEPPFGDEDERRFSRFQVEVLAKDTYCVIPAKAGIQNPLEILDSGLAPGLRRGCPE
jgi:hypothetical protein